MRTQNKSFAIALLAMLVIAGANAQAISDGASLSLTTDSIAPHRFLAVHGRRSLIEGYSPQGLEAWAYPFQILRDYRIGFRKEGTSTVVAGEGLLRRIIYEPQAVTRIYIGPDFIVRERLFVPLEEPGVIVSYRVESKSDIDIVVHFTPVLDLMWPGGLGGQSTEWNPSLAAYVISEPGRGYTATIGSPNIVAHDDTVNLTIEERNTRGLSFTIRPHESKTSVAFVLNPPHAADAGTLYHQLLSQESELEKQAVAHYAALQADALQIETPDPAVNNAIAWSQIALDQAWVCNPQLGCGLVAGYGPSRNARRPQYAWFFAGDGLVAINALTDEGEYQRARDALNFIAKYQQPGTGMIWHELSQSAGFLDWASYPYMYVHVDVTAQYLSTLSHYVAVSGDVAYAQDKWPSIDAAYHYCLGLLDPSDHLPRIPQGREGGDEQNVVSSDLSLSSGWLDASAAYADLASITGHSDEAKSALDLNKLGRTSITSKFWNGSEHYWIDAFTASGKPVTSLRARPSGILSQHVFTPQQNAEVLDQLATASYQTDWGTRGVPASSPAFQPESYASGSVSALGTADIATTFWLQHRPVQAFAMWRALIPWTMLDSLGHMHELLAGDTYHEQEESVPEQTWSSAGFIDASVRGLLGLTVDGQQNTIRFSPHLPAAWDTLTVSNVRLLNGAVALHLARVADGLKLDITNSGSAVALAFNPEIPLGAHLKNAVFEHHPVKTEIELHAEDLHAKLQLRVPHGVSECLIRYRDGFSIETDAPAPQLADSSKYLKITGIHLSGKALDVDVDVRNGSHSSFRVHTAQTLRLVSSGNLSRISPDIYEVSPPSPVEDGETISYTHVQVHLRLDGSAR